MGESGSGGGLVEMGCCGLGGDFKAGCWHAGRNEGLCDPQRMAGLPQNQSCSLDLQRNFATAMRLCPWIHKDHGKINGLFND